MLKASSIGPRSMDLSWSGVPMPRQNFVNLYRVLYLEEDVLAGSDPHSAFIVSNIDTKTSARIALPRPSMAYRVWMQAYLRNGKVIESNVLALHTEALGPHDNSKGMYWHSATL